MFSYIADLLTDTDPCQCEGCRAWADLPPDVAWRTPCQHDDVAACENPGTLRADVREALWQILPDTHEDPS